MTRLVIWILVLINLFITYTHAAQNNSDIIYPTEGTVWTVGEAVNVTFKETFDQKTTISIFFANDRLHNLGGGPASQKVFKFTVLSNSVSPENGTSLLLAVRRQSNYLESVDAVNVKVIPASSH